MRTHHRRYLALALVMCVCLLLSASYAILVIHTDHDCTGENCEMCRLLLCCQTHLRLISCLAVAVCLARWLERYRQLEDTGTTGTGCVQTLVSLCVQLTC